MQKLLRSDTRVYAKTNQRLRHIKIPCDTGNVDANSSQYDNISIFHVCMVWIEKSVTRVTDRHHEACRVMPNSDPE